VRITVEQRRARLAHRHHLAPGVEADDFAALAADMVGLHASSPASVYLAARARMTSIAVSEADSVMYEERQTLRMLGMRRTLFVVPLDLTPVLQAACTDRIAAGGRRRFGRLLERHGLASDGVARLNDLADATFAALEKRGEASATELSGDIPELRAGLRYGEGTTWAGKQSLTTIVLFLLSSEGRIVRGRRKGSWISSQHRWVPTATWLGAPLAHMDPAPARTELIRRWLHAFGPGTMADLTWWTGLRVAEVKRGLSEIEAVEVDLGPSAGFILRDDRETLPEPAPWAAFLPELDPTVMGWKERDWYLGEHRQALFDTSGNAGPTVWWCGRIVGGWAVRDDGSVPFRLLEDVGTEAREAIESEADRLTAWLAGTDAIPRSATPLARDLVS
jgi:hypothetical protein